MVFELFPKMFQELENKWPIDIGIGMETEIENHKVAVGGDTKNGNGGDLLMRLGSLEENRGTTLRCPTASDQRSH